MRLDLLAAAVGLALAVAELALASAWGHAFGLWLSVAATVCWLGYLAAGLLLPQQLQTLPWTHSESGVELTDLSEQQHQHSTDDDDDNELIFVPEALGEQASSGGGGTSSWYRRKGVARRLFLGVMGCLAVVLALLVVVRLLQWSDPGAAFPTHCPSDRTDACARLAADDSHRMQLADCRHCADFVLPQPAALLPRYARWLRRWLPGHGARLLTTTRSADRAQLWLHARCLSFFWGFADDLFVRLTVQNNATVSIAAQSQSRLGTSDFGVNPRRLAELADDMYKVK